MASDTKTCSVCNENKLKTEFYTRTQAGKSHPMALCKKCEIKRTASRKKADPAYAVRYRGIAAQNQADKQKQERLDGVNRDYYIFHDCRKSDKKRNRPNDLTREYIVEQIQLGCAFCGDTSIQMTLDRKDNSGGHTMDNTVPACIRCNLTRGSMPYDAWLIVAKGMREARTTGLFADWNGK